jgi:DNA-binding MarR family transcriptional regulator
MEQHQHLAAELAARRQRNPRYSLRAYARDLRIAPGILSQVLNGKRRLTVAQSNTISRLLGLDGAARAAFATPPRLQRTLPARWKGGDAGVRSLADDEFRVIAGWQHYAILGLIETPGFRSEPDWIAERLGLSVVTISAALRRLERVGLVTRVDGRLARVPQRLRTTTDVPSGAIRAYHRGMLRKGQDALASLDVDQRDFSSITIRANPAKLATAKQLIRDFRRSLTDLLQADGGDELFVLNVQLFPLTSPRSPEP